MKRSAGEGSIYKRSDGRFCASLTLPDGKRKYFYGSTRARAADKLSAALGEVKAGRSPEDGDITLRDFAAHWLEIITPKAKPRTVETYRENMEARVLPYLGDYKLRELTHARCQNMIIELQKPYYRRHESEPSTLSSNSIHLAATTLKSCLKYAVQANVIGSNPANDLILPRNGHKEMTIPTKRQVKRLIAKTTEPKLKAIIALAATMGLRKGEILGLSWEDVDMENTHTLRIRHTLTRTPLGYELVEPKTQKSRRTLKMTATVMSTIKDLGEPGDGRMFRVDPGNLHRQFKKALEDANVPEIRIHDLRHWYATTLLADGVQIKTVSSLLGHSSIVTTMDIYAKTLDEQKEQAADTMDEVLSLD